MITEWLDKYGNKNIYTQVKNECEIINKKIILKSRIKEYCKLHKLKFIKNYSNGFIASSKVDVKAGMKKVIGIDKFEHYDIRVIGKDEVFRHFLCYGDFDIVDNGVIKTN
jgi:hypothetical protein